MLHNLKDFLHWPLEIQWIGCPTCSTSDYFNTTFCVNIFLFHFIILLTKLNFIWALLFWKTMVKISPHPFVVKEVTTYVVGRMKDYPYIHIYINNMHLHPSILIQSKTQWDSRMTPLFICASKTSGFLLLFEMLPFSHVWLFANPWATAGQAILSFTISQELAQTHVHWVGDAIQLSYPLLSPSPPAFNLSQHQGLFQ